MTPQVLWGFADAVLLFHLGVIVFNVFGLVAIPVGAWRRWAFVRVFWWRALHLISWAAVALQAMLGRACFLTLWQSELLHGAGQTVSNAPLIQRWVSRLIYWPLPLWVFAVIYAVLCVYVVLLWWFVRPTLRTGSLSSSR